MPLFLYLIHSSLRIIAKSRYHASSTYVLLTSSIMEPGLNIRESDINRLAAG
jgi:hypothetical protein